MFHGTTRSVGPAALVGDNVVPLVGGGARDKGDDRLRVTQIEDFVGHAWFNINEIAGFVFDRFFAAGAEFVAHFSFDDVEDHFEVDVDVCVSHAARRNGRDVGRELRRVDVFA